MTYPQRSLFCFGLGDSALRLARRCLADGWEVNGTVRGGDKAARLRAEGIGVEVFSGRGALAPPPGADWVISIPPEPGGCPAFVAARAHAHRARSIIYLSTTGVYGDLGGGWAFEWSPVNPQNTRAERRVLAEDQWRGTGARVSIVRLPGIYGPGRSSFDRLGPDTRAIIKPGQVFSRVHLDDIAAGLAALIANDGADGVFHLTDDEPAPPQDVTFHAADLAGKPRPRAVDFEDADLSPMARSFYFECKRVSNARAKATLGWRPRYRTYREGLAAILAEEIR